MADWRASSEQWEAMWRLDAGFDTTAEESFALGREQVTFPDPYNLVQLAMRILRNEPGISIPPKSASDEDISIAERTERFLMGVWQRCSAQQQRDIVDDAKWFALVRGSAVFEVLWIRDTLPKELKDQVFPVMIRALDPRECYVKRGPIYTEWAFRRYHEDIINARQFYPDLPIWSEYENDYPSAGRHPIGRDKSGLTRMVEVIDFWYTDKKGHVYNCVLVEGHFAKEPKRMRSYPYIPYIEAFGDTAPLNNPAARRLSLLAPINGSWQYKCRLGSNLGTAVMWSVMPGVLISNENGEEIPDIQVAPGAVNYVPPGTRIDQMRQQADLNVLNVMMTQVEQAIQQSGFPSVMYGDSGSLQAGYSINLLTNAAMGRIASVRKYLEMAIQMVNELTLALIEHNAGEKGVELWALNNAEKKAYTETITPEEIGGYYRNIVTLEPAMPQDDNARKALGKQLADGGYISGRTLRANFLGEDVPADEESRIWSERAQNDEELSPRFQVIHMIERWPDVWEILVRGTKYEQAAMAMNLLPPPEPPPMQPMGGPPPGMMPPMGPEGMPPPGPPIQPPSPLMGPQGGAIGPEQMVGQMSPEQMGLPAQGMPLEFQALMNQDLPPSEIMQMLQNREVIP